MTREELINDARVLFNDCSKEENPEYLRGMVELITYSTLMLEEDSDEVAIDVECDILFKGE